jgi:transposase
MVGMHRDKVDMDQLKRVVAARKAGVSIRNLSSRFGVKDSAIMYQLKKASDLGLDVPKRKRKSNEA